MNEPDNDKPFVIMVDDNPEVLDLAVRYFRRKGVEIRTSDTPFGVASTIKRSAPDVLVLDVTMPALDGQRLAHLLEEDARLKKTPIIFYSAIDPAQGREIAQKFEGSRFVSKADGIRVLYDAVALVLGRSSPAESRQG